MSDKSNNACLCGTVCHQNEPVSDDTIMSLRLTLSPLYALILMLAGVQSAGASGVDRVSKYGMTPLYEEVLYGNVSEVKRLIAGGANVNFKTTRRAKNPGRTPLYVAALIGHTPIIKLLLEAGADPNIKSPSGRTPLYNAVIVRNITNNSKLAKLLLEHGADPNISSRADDGRTPLHEAVVLPAKASKLTPSRVEVAILLLEHGADPNRKDKYGITPLWLVSGIPHRKFTRDLSHPELHALMLVTMDPTSDKYVRPCYTVQKTDIRLSIIAGKALGDGSRWPEISTLNGISKENPYRLGDCLQLPQE